MSTLVKKVALPKIRKFCYTLVKVNEGYDKAKMNKQDFHLRLRHIAQLLGDDGDKTYFNNVQLDHLVTEFVRREELDGTVVNTGTYILVSSRYKNSSTSWPSY